VDLNEPENNTVNISTSRGFQVDRLPFTSWAKVQQHWKILSAQLSPPSVFLSSEWTGTWIEVYGQQLRPEIIVFRDGNTIVGMCLLVAKTLRYGPFTVRVLHINAAGEDEADGTCIEYNGILALPEYEAAVAMGLGKLVDDSKWDELRCDGFQPGLALDALDDTLVGMRRIDSVRPSRYVDLCAVRDSGKDYLATLGATTRSHIRQYFKKYMTAGELRVRAAEDSGEALTMLSELESLHQKNWSSRGKPGSFSSEKFRLFHKELIHRMFPLGAIQMLQVQAGSSIIGYLYNFIYAIKVYYYQSGFNYTEKKLSPGLVTIACAVQFCLDLGLEEFDFLAGDYQYKRALAMNQRDLIWTVFRRTNWRMRTLDRMRRARRRWMAQQRSE
jgi:hypothetical protein